MKCFIAWCRCQSGQQKSRREDEAQPTPRRQDQHERRGVRAAERRNFDKENNEEVKRECVQRMKVCGGTMKSDVSESKSISRRMWCQSTSGCASWIRPWVHMVFEPFRFTLSGVLWENAHIFPEHAQRHLVDFVDVSLSVLDSDASCSYFRQ